jgi:hypothetical protein
MEEVTQTASYWETGIALLDPLELFLKPQDFTESGFGNATQENTAKLPQFFDCMTFRAKWRSWQVAQSRHVPLLFPTIHVIKPFLEEV